jgi:uncharacterized Zn finger protein (UPF0148 family)
MEQAKECAWCDSQDVTKCPRCGSYYCSMHGGALYCQDCEATMSKEDEIEEERQRRKQPQRWWWYEHEISCKVAT